MQFREVGSRIQVLAAVWDKAAGRSRQRLVLSIPRFGPWADIAPSAFEALPDEKRQAAADEVNGWIAERRTEADKRALAYAPTRLRGALDQFQQIIADEPETISDADLDALADALRAVQKLVANRNRSRKVKAARAARASASDQPA